MSSIKLLENMENKKQIQTPCDKDSLNFGNLMLRNGGYMFFNEEKPKKENKPTIISK
jgi:hypothetical protein